MERQAKDGTFYQQVGKDEWTPVTRKDKQGNVYKKVGEDAWSLLTDNKPKESTGLDKSHAALEGFAKSSSMGALPYLKAGVEKYVTDPLAEAAFGVPASDSSYSERVAQARSQGNQVTEKAPGYALGGEIAGFLAPGMAVSKGVGLAGKALGIQGAAKTAPLASRLASQSGRLATEGAVFGAAYTPETGFGDVGARAEAAATGAAFGAAMPPAMHVAGKTLGAAAKAPGWAGKKLLSSLGGVKQEVIERYLQNPERIRSAKTFDELYETTTKIVSKLGDDLDDAKISFDAAKQHLSEVADGIKNSRIEGRDAALEKVTQAKALLDESFKNQKAGLQSKASPSSLGPVVSDALDTLKSRVVEGSSKSFETLSDKSVAINEPWKAINQQLKNLAGETADDSKAAAAKLKEIANSLFNKVETSKGGKISVSAEAIKKQIQSIDRDVKQWEVARGAFDTDYGRQLKAFRNQLDDVLKSSFPEYKAQMAQVADDAKILGDASKRFGKPERALSRLGNLDRPSARYDFESAKALAGKVNPELSRQIDDVAKAQRTLKSPLKMDDLKRSLPEASALREAEMKAAAAKRLAKPKLVKETILKHSATQKLKTAQERLKDQKEIFDRLKSFGEQGAESKLQQVARGRRFAETQLRELSQYADEDLVEAVKAAQDAAAFDKTIFHGSRNVNLWAMLGSAVQNTATGKGGAGAVAGGVFGGPMGMAIGATVGALVDNYGPKVTKQILDAVVKAKGPMSELVITKMKLPENVKAELAEQFRRTIVAERVANTAKSAGRRVADEKQKGEKKWANDGFDNLLKHAPDQADLNELKDTLLKDPKTKRLLIDASSLKPGSKAMDKILNEIKQKHQIGISSMGVE